jgi:fatty-acyl-CoA synthase
MTSRGGAAAETLAALVDELGERFGPRQAVAGEASSLTYRELAAGADRVAAALIHSGVVKGTRVGLLAPNRPEWLTAAFGIVKTGAILVALNTLSRRAELEYALRHADVSWLLAVPRFLKNDYASMIAEIAPEALRGGIAACVPQLRRIVFLGDAALPGTTRLDELVEAASAVGDEECWAVEATVSPSDPAIVFFTSGSTAEPKAAVLGHRALVHNGRAVGDAIGITPDDRTWTALPLFFSGGFCLCALSTLTHGAAVVLNEVFAPGAALERLAAERCTVMVGWNHVAQMVEHPTFDRSRLSLRKGVGGNLPLADRFLQPGHVAVGCYGMTENATCCTSARWDDPPEVRRTFGRPLPGVELRVVDPGTGRALPQGEEGEICVRSPAQMMHYYGTSPDDCFDREGFFHTGDLGFVDERGCLHFVKRLKDVIKTMGVNVAAPEVEQALEAHPDVARAVVVGVSHPIRGENVAAFVVPRRTGLAAEELVEHCRARLAPYKIPRHFFFCEESALPISASNKVEKGKLRERAEREIAAAGEAAG